MIRTDFAHEDEWTRLQAAIVETQVRNGYPAYVEFVDDKAYEGLSVSRLLRIVPADSNQTFAFLADTQTLTHPDRPILVVNLYDLVNDLADEGRGPQYGATFRIIPAELYSVHANLSLANMDWEDFAENVDDDGIFRDFKPVLAA